MCARRPRLGSQAYSLAVRSGVVTHTSVAGLTLSGGIGRIMRKHRLTIDQLVSVDLVTAEGELTQASADPNADLSGECLVADR